ncbi:MAG: hypothetical protein MI921_04540 [Cytophagales bacterium]|nr:hypothetical protein [Cytophagales bacterium]
MIDKQIDLLQKQIQKLEAKDMDLEAWKSSTIVLLERIFGENNQRVKHIEAIKYDYSSWSLRDASGSMSQLDSCKKRGKEILEMCISELENFGLPQSVLKEQDSFNIIINALEEELTVSQYREIKKIITADMDNKEKKESLDDALKDYGADTEKNILMSILTNLHTRENI